MDKKILCLLALAALACGCANNYYSQSDTGIYSPAQPGYAFTTSEQLATGEKARVFNPLDVEQEALPKLADLPTPPGLRRHTAKYTGIIKNKTRYDLSIPAANSDATLTLPARGWIEYTAWTNRFDVTAYRDGKPFYCMKVDAHPKEYPFMCKNYDFICEVVRPEPASGPSKLKPRKIKRKAKKQAPC